MQDLHVVDILPQMITLSESYVQVYVWNNYTEKLFVKLYLHGNLNFSFKYNHSKSLCHLEKLNILTASLKCYQ